MDTYLFYGYEFLSEFLPFFLLFVTWKHFRKKSGLTNKKLSDFLLLLFVIYIMGVYHFTGAGTLYEGLRNQWEFRNNLNVVPFSNDIDLVGYLLNILLFLPLGILVPLLWEQLHSLLCMTGIGVAFSLFIEGSQLLNFRATDVDDLILNTVGTVIGFTLYQVFDRITESKYQQKEIPLTILPISILLLFFGRFFLFNDMGLAKLLYGF